MARKLGEGDSPQVPTFPRGPMYACEGGNCADTYGLDTMCYEPVDLAWGSGDGISGWLCPDCSDHYEIPLDQTGPLMSEWLKEQVAPKGL